MVQSVSIVRSPEFFGFGIVLGSGGTWDEAGGWLLRIGGKGWVF